VQVTQSLQRAGARTIYCAACEQQRRAEDRGYSSAGIGLGRSLTRPARALPVRMISVLGDLKLDERPTFNDGDTVCVAESVIMRHLPKKVTGDSGKFDAQGCVGVVLKAYDEPNLSPNRPIKVEFEAPTKWIGHFEPEELVLVQE